MADDDQTGLSTADMENLNETLRALAGGMLAYRSGLIEGGVPEDIANQMMLQQAIYNSASAVRSAAEALMLVPEPVTKVLGFFTRLGE